MMQMMIFSSICNHSFGGVFTKWSRPPLQLCSMHLIVLIAEQFDCSWFAMPEEHIDILLTATFAAMPFLAINHRIVAEPPLKYLDNCISLRIAAVVYVKISTLSSSPTTSVPRWSHTYCNQKKISGPRNAQIYYSYHCFIFQPQTFQSVFNIAPLPHTNHRNHQIWNQFTASLANGALVTKRWLLTSLACIITSSIAYPIIMIRQIKCTISSIKRIDRRRRAARALSVHFFAPISPKPPLLLLK